MTVNFPIVPSDRAGCHKEWRVFFLWDSQGVRGEGCLFYFFSPDVFVWSCSLSCGMFLLFLFLIFDRLSFLISLVAAVSSFSPRRSIRYSRFFLILHRGCFSNCRSWEFPSCGECVSIQCRMTNCTSHSIQLRANRDSRGLYKCTPHRDNVSSLRSMKCLFARLSVLCSARATGVRALSH